MSDVNFRTVIWHRVLTGLSRSGVCSTTEQAQSRSSAFLSSLCAGFQQQLSAVLNADDMEHNIGEALMKLSGGRQPSRVICTGHSLGGALATLCAPWCAIEYPKADVRCVTFGSPRVGACSPI